MLFPSSSDRAIAQAISSLAYCNPFLPERIEYERQALKELFQGRKNVLSKHDDLEDKHPNILGLGRRIEQVMGRTPVEKLSAASPSDREIYLDMVHYRIYDRFRTDFDRAVELAIQTGGQTSKRRTPLFGSFLALYEQLLPGLASPKEVAHLFALFFQVRRAFKYIFDSIIGDSMPAAQLRAAVWQSVFTHDMKRYQRSLHHRLGDITTLITGPSGTGKELVAKAIGGSRYIPFDPVSETFAGDFSRPFYPLNLSALSPTLIESELFGHKRGSFTGALQDRIGWLEICPVYGTVFLDEIGELDGALQVKLLRVLQTREFQRIGESTERIFKGKIIAATNRDLAREMKTGRFREDMYYRLCADVIVTPSLKEQIIDAPGVLATLVRHLAAKLIGEEEGPALAEESTAWIESNLGLDYAWPGNVRELEQCLRNIMIRKSYQPPVFNGEAEGDDDHSPKGNLARQMKLGAYTADELLTHYCSLVQAQTGTYQETARRLQLDHRTVKKYLDEELIKRYGEK